MIHFALQSISPLEGRYHEKLTDLRPIFSEFALIKFRVLIEIHWLQTFIKHTSQSPLTSHAENILQDIINNFSEKDAVRIKNIEAVINHDVKAVEYFLKERISGNKELAALTEYIHFGCTSEDINNLAYGLMLDTARKQVILPSLDELITFLTKLAHENADVPMLARTHGQPASPTSVGKEFANFVARIKRQMEEIIAIPILGKMNGASGNYNALNIAFPDIDWQLVTKNFVTSLSLSWNPYTTQIEPHDFIAELFSALVRVNTILIDFNRDMWGYIALNYFNQKSLKSEVGSSTMPHKINPIDFENAEGNLGLANALFMHMIQKLPISRWQRDLSDSTVLRNVGVAIAHAYLGYASTSKGLGKLQVNEESIQHDLNQHWEILAEPVQTVMRRYGVEQPYEQLKAFSRGQRVTKELLHAFIQGLAIPDDVKETLYKLTPSTYLGYANDLAKRI